MNRSEITTKHILEVFNYVVKTQNAIAISLYGADNYGLVRPESDRDYIVITVPTIEELAFNAKQKSATHEYKDGSTLLELKDIRLINNRWMAAEHKYLEALVSTCRCDNCDELKYFYNNVNEIAHANEEGAMKEFIKYIREKHRDLTRLLPTQREEVETYGYCAKQLHHCLRALEMMQRYMHEPYKDIYKTNDVDYLLSIKNRSANISADEAIKLANDTLEKAECLYNNTSTAPINEKLHKEMTAVVLDVIKTKLYESFNNM